ncbi:ArnT family glycosyltransferase [Fluviispira multicolorata]|uniref:Glycosyltransferase RgtA/B/C/D-like domain-containing protein n=1 Tax=Fluviispira multicolorata TaxID=2654512 RepID=A0A833JFP3_9BACT|nr:glycosyltransferase family 39 protein [Fluviispira multicolorata]KAB8033425.1 hypothetical protein GCL57_01615 [Fluviispira multicolorata]
MDLQKSTNKLTKVKITFMRYPLNNFFSKTNLQQEFQIKNRWFLFSIFIFFSLRFFWIANFPMSNDEVYYWDWSRHLQLSYVDAPPFVAWMSFLGTLLLPGATGARFLIPFIHTFSTLFILFSAKKFATLNTKKFTNEMALSVLIFTQITPVFNLEGILLLPDATLLLGLSGALYFLLSAFNSCIKSVHELFSFKYALCFGFFLGIAALSKYHTFPIAVGFLIASLYLRYKIDKKIDIAFWITGILVSMLVASPVFIWNFQNNFASFHFQSQHGFAGFSLDFKSFFRYLLGSLFYLLPWFFILSIAFVNKFFAQPKKISSYYLLSILPFTILFLLISFSALGKQALPHWAMPGFYLLIPAIVNEWKPFTGTRIIAWKIYCTISLIISVIVPTAICTQSFNNLLIKTFIYFTGNASPLAQVFQWQTLQDELKNQLNIKLKTQPYPTNENCSSHYQIASLRWYWTAQMAFYFNNQPKIYNFDFTNTSFYSWRDPLYNLEGCKFIVLGSLNHYNEANLEKVMNIEYQEEFSLSPYDDNKIILIKGTMKSKEILNKVYEKNKREIRY